MNEKLYRLKITLRGSAFANVWTTTHNFHPMPMPQILDTINEWAKYEEGKAEMTISITPFRELAERPR